MKNITVIGSGTMGNGIAHCFAQNQFNVLLVDLSKDQLKKAITTINKNLDRQVAKEVISTQQKEETLGRIKTSTVLKDSLKEADLIIEAVSENITVKADLFKKMDALTPAHCILASNTSSISITKLGSFTKRPEKVIGIHFMNPVPIMRLIEVIQGFKTDNDTLSQILTVSKALDKTPAISFIPTPEDIRDKYQYFTEANMDKLKSIGYNTPFHTLEEGVNDYVKNYLSEKKYF